MARQAGLTAGGLHWWTARRVLEEAGPIVAGDHIAQVDARLARAGTEVTGRLPSGRLIAAAVRPQLAIPFRSGIQPLGEPVIYGPLDRVPLEKAVSCGELGFCCGIGGVAGSISGCRCRLPTAW